MKVYYVTNEQRMGKKQVVSKVVGFVSIFGWESQKTAIEKASAKYPHMSNWSVHEAPKRKYGR